MWFTPELHSVLYHSMGFETNKMTGAIFSIQFVATCVETYVSFFDTLSSQSWPECAPGLGSCMVRAFHTFRKPS